MSLEEEFIEAQQSLDGLIKYLTNEYTEKFEKLNLFGKEFIADENFSVSALDDIDFDDRHLLFPEEFLKPGPGSPVPDLWVDDYKVVYDIDVRDLSQVLREDLRLLVNLVIEDVFVGDTDVLEKTIVKGFRIDIVDTQSANGTITGFGFTRTTDKPMLVIEMNPILGPEDNFLIQEGTFVANPYIEEFYPQNRSTRLAVLKGEIPLINTQEGNYEKKIDMLKFHTTENPSIGPKQKSDMLRMLEISKNEELALAADIPASSQIDRATNLIDIEDTPEGVASDIVPDDISSIDTPTNVVDDFGQKGIKWADARKTLEDVNNWGEDIPILEERFIGNTNDKIILEIIPPEGNVEGLIPSEDYRLQASILRENGDIEIIKTYNNARQFGADGKNFFNDISSIDTPTNVGDEVVVTSATENLKQSIPTNADGNIVLYRSTTDPNVNILSDFTDTNRSNQAGLGQQSFYAIDEMYAYNYSRPSINKNVYKFETNIKPNQVLNIQSPTNAQLSVLEKIGITSQDLKNWNMFNTGEVNKKIQNNLDFLLENNIKAIGNNKIGGSSGVFDYEVVPIITEKTQTEIKPVSQLILDPNWEGTDRILNVENELFQSTQSTQLADKYLPIDVNDPNTKYRPVYYVDEEGIGRKAKDFQFSEQPLENNLVKDNLIEVPVDTNTNVNLVNDTYVLSTDTPGGSLGAAKLNDPLVFDSWVDNLGRTTASFVDNLPLETVVKNRIKNLITTKTKQLTKPASLIVKAVDAWEFGVIGLMAAGIAFNEIDEVPTIINNTAINMFNSMTASYGIAPVAKEEYDIDYEFINTVLDTGSKVMPTDIIIEKLKPYSLEEGEDVILPGTGVTATTGEEQQFEPYGEELAKRAEKTVNIKRDEVKQKLLESKGVQEEKMFEQTKPKKSSGGGSGAKIL